MALLLPGALPEIETVNGRFILRPFTPADVEPLVKILLRDEIWSQGYGAGEHRPGSLADLAGFIHRRHESHRIFSVFRVEPGRQDRFIGTTGVMDLQAQQECAKVGRTVLDPCFWGAKANHEGSPTGLALLLRSRVDRMRCGPAKPALPHIPYPFWVQGGRYPAAAIPAGGRDLAERRDPVSAPAGVARDEA